MIKKAYEIAKKDLRSCYFKNGILAGLKHFDDYWARDSFFASLGSTYLKDFDIVKKNLTLYLSYQKKDGQLPRKLERTNTFLKYIFKLKIQKPIKPIYKGPLNLSKTTDQNSLFIISLLNYIKDSKDIKFLENNFEKIKKAIDWYETTTKDYLINEGYFSGWEDSTFKKGKLIYTNVLYCKALDDFIEMLKLLKKDSSYYKKLKLKVKNKLNELFWNKDYYLAWIDNKKHKEFLADGNLLAIIYEVADKSQGKKILNYMKKINMNKSLLNNVYPKYIFRLSPTRYLSFTLGYHTKYEWIWLSCLNVLAKLKLGMKKEAKKDLELIAKKIIEYNNVYEVYYKGRPVNKLLFRSEVPFAWSSGMFVYVSKFYK